MASENGERNVTFKAAFGLVLGVLLSIAGLFWSALDTRVKNVEARTEMKVDKEDFIRALEKIDRQYERIDVAIREHERRASSRSRD